MIINSYNEYMTDKDYYELWHAMALAMIEYSNLPELQTPSGFLFY